MQQMHTSAILVGCHGPLTTPRKSLLASPSDLQTHRKAQVEAILLMTTTDMTMRLTITCVEHLRKLMQKTTVFLPTWLISSSNKHVIKAMRFHSALGRKKKFGGGFSRSSLFPSLTQHLGLLVITLQSAHTL